ncbi:MAG: electron transporter RnfD [Nitrospirae bacterium CG_4_10_14_3_um_filter_44_29]|nr:MAG: electron transporter RnfD [Nitrospirae bacterium CG1_02_44_142]PIP71223.1 MAG: electron transporter RnfD [Nitrospirae bacterium CG22_combo_CG10-13_8_21_14_all_44_11]PIV40396.1 MAG: electron transporter RnfD [Nitrospirae bacterium CG02_land_8_20_14_3_00_44_33]PIV65822.1 MAG: electron transporter RnfD [Nitrospirae bacterium CG01_land_8_20_14_3_00_44_22]PIW90444.1 MAG: electron transporter RnfD [Nitrospirae bacterium CG_4_8_14_3_um_filter_44_28]PIX87400.1 MAG: electron transporter RnfD [N
MADVKKEHELIVTVSPHVRDEETTSRIMWSVSISLLPAVVMGAYFFGPRAVFTVALAIISALLSEYLFQKALKKKIAVNDGSAFLTGLLLGMNLPASVPFYIPIIGSFIAVIIAKQLFGGLGYNVFNPALIGRAFLLISFPRLMTIWTKPDAAFVMLDATTTATPLGILKEEGLSKLIEVFGDKINLYAELFNGHRAGSIGETSALALLIGAGFLLYKRYITWHVPASFLGTVAVLAWIFGGKSPETGKMLLFAGDPLIHLLSGGLMLGAFFMATDYVTCPSARKGQIVFGIGCGFLTMLIRLKGGYPEGVMFAILLMNCFAPLIDRGFKSKVFGALEKTKAREIKK